MVKDEKALRTLYADELYILDQEHVGNLYDHAPEFTNKDDAPCVSGLYILRNETNGKIYVGQAKSIRSRMSDHYQKGSKVEIDQLLCSCDEQISKKYVVLDDSGFPDLNALETAFIAYFDSYRTGYNRTRGNKLLLEKSGSRKGC